MEFFLALAQFLFIYLTIISNPAKIVMVDFSFFDQPYWNTHGYNWGGEKHILGGTTHIFLMGGTIGVGRRTTLKEKNLGAEWVGWRCHCLSGGMLVKMDFRSYSGSHRSRAWIQNPSSSWVWQYHWNTYSPFKLLVDFLEPLLKHPLKTSLKQLWNFLKTPFELLLS